MELYSSLHHIGEFGGMAKWLEEKMSGNQSKQEAKINKNALAVVMSGTEAQREAADVAAAFTVKPSVSVTKNKVEGGQWQRGSGRCCQ